MAKKPTQLFRRLVAKADLSNQVSATALFNARKTWTDYAKTANNQRATDDLVSILTELGIIVKQVCAGDCRINPETRADLVTLIELLKHSLATGKILEPLPEPANDDDADDKEAA